MTMSDEMEEDEEDDDDYGEDNKFRVEVKRSTKGQSAQRKIFEETFETVRMVRLVVV